MEDRLSLNRKLKDIQFISNTKTDRSIEKPTS